MLKGKMEFRLGSEQRICGQGDVVVIPGNTEHEAWFREDTEVIDFFVPPRDDFLLGGKPAYMSAEQLAPSSPQTGACSICSTGAPRHKRGQSLESSTDAGSAVIAQIATGLLEAR